MPLDHVMVLSISAGTVFVLVVVWAAWCYAFGTLVPFRYRATRPDSPWVDCTVAGWMIVTLLLAMFVMWAIVQPAL